MIYHQKKNWKSYCSEPLELVENYAAAKAENFQEWDIHHRLEIQPDGTRVSMQELKDKNLYYGRPASELIFMRRPEHNRLHLIGNTFFKGKHLSEEARRKLSESLKGRTLSAETRRKMSKTRKGKHKSAEHRQKISEALKGKHHSAETRQKMSEANKGKHWWNDGVSCKYSRECPGPEWKRGILKV